MNRTTIDQRTQTLLKTLIEHYIAEGAPVGSKVLAQRAGLEISPATIRNIMSELENQGFLQSPHTSAGRIPTVKAYRLFVDRLITMKPLEQQQINQVKQTLNPDQPALDLIKSASELLSNLTDLVGIVMLPKREQISLRHIEFLPLSDKRILVILVLNTKDVENRIIRVEHDYSHEALIQAANFINQTYSGKSLQQIRQHVLQQMRHDKEQMNQMMQLAIDMAAQALNSPRQTEDCVVVGETNLFNVENQNLDRLRELMEAFRYKQSILNLLDRCLVSNGIQLFIGDETGQHVLDQCSIVTAPYRADDTIVGVLGVIGPTRMSYDKIIPVVDVTAKLLSVALKSEN